MPSEQWVQTACSPFSFSGNELCCTVLFTLSSYQSQNSTETANWKGQPGTVCSFSRLDVYRRQSNFFLSTKTKMLGDCQIPLVKMCTFTRARRRGWVYLWSAVRLMRSYRLKQWLGSHWHLKWSIWEPNAVFSWQIREPLNMGDCSEALSTMHVLSQYITVIEYSQVYVQKNNAVVWNSSGIWKRAAGDWRTKSEW